MAGDGLPVGGREREIAVHIVRVAICRLFKPRAVERDVM
jgi:hypothetical protein